MSVEIGTTAMAARGVSSRPSAMRKSSCRPREGPSNGVEGAREQIRAEDGPGERILRGGSRSSVVRVWRRSQWRPAVVKTCEKRKKSPFYRRIRPVPAVGIDRTEKGRARLVTARSGGSARRRLPKSSAACTVGGSRCPPACVGRSTGPRRRILLDCLGQL